jgi:hypothetical protein
MLNARDGLAASARDGLGDLLTAQVLPLVATLIINFGSAAALGPADRGDFAFQLSGAYLVGALFYGSLHVPAANAVRDGDGSAVRRSAGLCIAVTALLLALAAVCAMFAAPSLGLVTQPRSVAVLLGAALVVVNLFVTRTVQALGQVREYRNAFLVQSVAYLILALPVLVWFATPGRLLAAWAAAVAVGTAVAARTLVLTSRALPSRGATWPRRRLAKTAMAAHIGVAGQQLLFRADLLALGVFSTSRQVGFYALAVSLAELVWIVPEALSLATFGEGTVALERDARQERVRRFVCQSLVVSLLLGLLIAVGSYVLVATVLPAFTRTPVLVLMLLPGVVVGGVPRILLSATMVAGHGRAAVRYGAVSAGLALLYIPATWLFGAPGAAISSSVVYAAMALFARSAYRRMLAVPR